MTENTRIKYEVSAALVHKLYLEGLLTMREVMEIEKRLFENFERIDRVRILPAHQKIKKIENKREK